MLADHAFDAKVLNGGEDFPKRKGRLVHVASDPLQPKEIVFIEEMHAGGACPSVKMFEGQFGTVVETINRIYRLGHF